MREGGSGVGQRARAVCCNLGGSGREGKGRCPRLPDAKGGQPGTRSCALWGCWQGEVRRWMRAHAEAPGAEARACGMHACCTPLHDNTAERVAVRGLGLAWHPPDPLLESKLHQRGGAEPSRRYEQPDAHASGHNMGISCEAPPGRPTCLRRFPGSSATRSIRIVPSLPWWSAAAPPTSPRRAYACAASSVTRCSSLAMFLHACNLQAREPCLLYAGRPCTSRSCAMSWPHPVQQLGDTPALCRVMWEVGEPLWVAEGWAATHTLQCHAPACACMPYAHHAMPNDAWCTARLGWPNDH